MLSISRTQEKIEKAVINVFLFIISLIMLFPAFWLASSAFMSNAEITSIPVRLVPEYPHWENFPQLFQRFNIARFYLNSFIFAGCATLLVVFSSSLAGFIFAKYNFRFKNFLFIIVLSVMMLPISVSLVPLYVILAKFKMIDTFAGLIIPNAVMSFAIFLMRQFILSIPDDLIYSMRIDGSSEIGIWGRLIIPSTKPALASITIFAFMFTWDQFLFPLIVSTTARTRPLVVALSMFQQEWWADYNLMMAGSLLAVLPLVIIYFFAQRQFIEGITLTGIKG